MYYLLLGSALPEFYQNLVIYVFSFFNSSINFKGTDESAVYISVYITLLILQYIQ
jgi:hypothetical protein